MLTGFFKNRAMRYAGLCLLAISGFGAPGPMGPGHGSASVSVSPATATLGVSQTVQMTATISGQTQSVVWSLYPAVGSISASGMYTAPAMIDAPQVILVTATSTADPTQSATAALILNPSVAVSLSPSGAALTSSETQQFTPIVTGTSNPAVTWSLSPETGAVSSTGLYTPPASITAQQTILLTATSVVDPTQSATVPIVLSPVVGISISPASLTLQAGMMQQFVASVSGTQNAAVTWSLNPPVGNLTSSGVYTAPVPVSFQRSVTVIASSQADPTQRATSTITLEPGLSVTVSPSCVSLSAAQSQQFAAIVAGAANTAVTWSLTGAGTLSASGTYTAPPTVTNTQVVTVTATSLTDSSQSGQVSFLLLNSPPGGGSAICHWVVLSWVPSVSNGVTGYNIYRAGLTGSYNVIAYNVGGSSYIDITGDNGQPFQDGESYSYYLTSIAGTSESTASTKTQATIP